MRFLAALTCWLFAASAHAHPWSVDYQLLSAGPIRGKHAQPNTGVYGPTWNWSMSLGASFWYVHGAVGFDFMSFDDRDPPMLDVTDLQGENEQTVTDRADAISSFAEVGLNIPLLIRLARGKGDENQFIELLPCVTYGKTWVGPLRRSISDCIDCSIPDVNVDYVGGDYAGFMLGTFWTAGDPLRGAFGLTTTYRHFLNPGEHALIEQLSVGLTLRIAAD
jgi:hypothetical protein